MCILHRKTLSILCFVAYKYIVFWGKCGYKLTCMNTHRAIYASIIYSFIIHIHAHAHTQSAEALLQLKEADAFVADCDDRRYVIQISHPALRK